MRRALERRANESLRCVAGGRGWERCESGRSNRVKIEPETRSPARGELRAPSDAAGSLRPIQGEGRGPSPPLGAAGFRGQILGLPTKGLRESGDLLFLRTIACPFCLSPRHSHWGPIVEPDDRTVRCNQYVNREILANTERSSQKERFFNG